MNTEENKTEQSNNYHHVEGDIDPTAQSVTTSTENHSQTIKLSDEEAIKAYVNDPQIKADHLRIAKELEQVFEKRWFTAEMVAKKTLMKDQGMIAQMMLGLQLFNLVTAAEGGINYKHQTKFKITISIEDRLKVLDQHKENHLKQIELIDQEKEKLLQEQSAGENNQ